MNLIAHLHKCVSDHNVLVAMAIQMVLYSPVVHFSIFLALMKTLVNIIE